jgi:hypothetical protein
VDLPPVAIEDVPIMQMTRAIQYVTFRRLVDVFFDWLAAQLVCAPLSVLSKRVTDDELKVVANPQSATTTHTLKI